jgi:hypothetical protein
VVLQLRLGGCGTTARLSQAALQRAQHCGACADLCITRPQRALQRRHLVLELLGGGRGVVGYVSVFFLGGGREGFVHAAISASLTFCM